MALQRRDPGNPPRPVDLVMATDAAQRLVAPALDFRLVHCHARELMPVVDENQVGFLEVGSVDLALESPDDLILRLKNPAQVLSLEVVGPTWGIHNDEHAGAATRR